MGFRSCMISSGKSEMAKLEPAKIEFKWRRYVRRYERECTYNTCNSLDAYLWSKQAVKWLTAQRKRATTPEQIRLTKRQIKLFHGAMARSKGCVTTCRSAVGAFASLVRLSKLATESWGKPVFVDEVPFLWPSDQPRGIQLTAEDNAWLKKNPQYVGLMASMWVVAKTQVDKLGDDIETAMLWRVLPWVAGGFGVFVLGTFVVAQARAPRKFAGLK